MGTDTMPLTDEELATRLVRGTAEQAAHLAWWLATLAEFDRREAWQGAGMISCVAWLVARCGSSARTAREHVWVAHRLEDAPLTRTALSEGRLSYSKVRLLCRVVRVDNEAFLVGLAEDMSASQLERHLRQYVATTRPATTAWDDVEALEARCGVTSWIDEHGLQHHEIVTTPEEGVVIDRAIDLGREMVHRERTERGTPQPVRRPGAARRRHDGLVWACRRGLLNAGRDDGPTEEPFLMVFHIRRGEAAFDERGNLDLGDGTIVPKHVAERLRCGSMVQAMLVDGDDRPLDLGRRSRVASPKQKLALSALHERCAFPDCSVPIRFCQFHHVHHWIRDQGPTDLDNLLPVCRHHHRLLHEGGWSMWTDDGTEGRAVAISPTGARVVAGGPLTEAAIAATALPDRLDDLGLGHDGVDPSRYDSIAGRWGGERLTAWARAEIGSAIADACQVPELLDERAELDTRRGQRTDPPVAA